MPLRPGIQVLVKSAPSPRSAPTDTGVWFVVGLTDAGPANTPVDVYSIDDVNAKLGGRVTYSSLYDALDVFFREGGNHAVVSRVAGPAAVKATRNLLDAGAGVSLVVTAAGAWCVLQRHEGAGHGGRRRRHVSHPHPRREQRHARAELRPDDTAGRGHMVAVQQLRQDHRRCICPGPGGSRSNCGTAGGADDRTNIVDAQWQAALDGIPAALGPGQVSAPGRTTSAGQLQLLAHALAKNRFALLDLADSPTAATLQAAAAAVGKSRYGMIAGAPWVIVPGVVSGTTRTVPPSAFTAGKIAETDAAAGPDTPAAGVRGIARFVIGLSQPFWDNTTRDALNTSGVNVIRQFSTDFRLYGWRSLADPNADPNWLDAGVPRLIMAITAECQNIAESFVFAVIDGQGKMLSAFAGALTSVCQRFYSEGNLYGATAADAFNVDVGPTVNTPASLANNEARANVAVRPSPDAELVTINIVNVPITQGVS
jgi:hypothetical protein